MTLEDFKNVYADATPLNNNCPECGQAIDWEGK